MYAFLFLFRHILISFQYDSVYRIARSVICDSVAQDLVNISLNMHNTRAVQKISCPVIGRQVVILFPNLHLKLKNEQQTDHGYNTQLHSIVVALSLHVLINDLNGNHVIQKCLNKLTPEDNQYISTWSTVSHSKVFQRLCIGFVNFILCRFHFFICLHPLIHNRWVIHHLVPLRRKAKPRPSRKQHLCPSTEKVVPNLETKIQAGIFHGQR
jgi:hypothetical protein